MFEVYNKAAELPQSWDQLVEGNIFLTKTILGHLEKLNPCQQTYHLDTTRGIALVTYKLKLDIFTFAQNIALKVPVNIVGIPLSTAKSGYALKDKARLEEMVQYIKSLKGFYLILNSEDELNLAQGNTLPTCRLEIRWQKFSENLQALRSHYRYRAKKALNKFNEVKITELEDNNSFDQAMYRLYLEVYEHSEAKLEKLPIEFFREFPAKIFKFTLNNETIAFLQLVAKGEELIFLLGGFHRSYNERLDLYYNLLLKLVDYAIEKGYKYLDLGQTAEETKLKLGASQYPKYMYAYHSNPLFNGVISKLIPSFSYQPYAIKHRVFKEENDENPLGKMS